MQKTSEVDLPAGHIYSSESIDEYDHIRTSKFRVVEEDNALNCFSWARGKKRKKKVVDKFEKKKIKKRKVQNNILDTVEGKKR